MFGKKIFQLISYLFVIFATLFLFVPSSASAAVTIKRGTSQIIYWTIVGPAASCVKSGGTGSGAPATQWAGPPAATNANPDPSTAQDGGQMLGPFNNVGTFSFVCTASPNPPGSDTVTVQDCPVYGEVWNGTACVSAPTYTITVTQGANGTISPGTVSGIASGANQSFTITPSGGYNISSVVVDGASVGTGGTYTFNNITANHTITASYVVATCGNGATNPPTCNVCPGTHDWNGASCVVKPSATLSPPAAVNYNTAGTLSWTSGGATSGCSINANTGANIGVVTPTAGGSVSTGARTATTIFTLTCSNGVTSANSSQTLTVNSVVPTVTTPTHSAVTFNSATLGGTVTSNGGSAITARGTCWGLTANPITNCLNEGGTAVSAFTQSRTSLPSATTIYYRAYADNAVGRGWSSGSSFVSNAAPSGNFTPPATPACTIPAGSSSCNPTLSWTTANIPSTNLKDCGGGLYGNYPVGAQSASVFTPYNAGCYRIENAADNSILATVNVTASCAAGSSWNGTICNAVPAVTFVSSNQTVALNTPLTFSSDATDGNNDMVEHGLTWQNPSGLWEYQAGGGSANITGQSAGANFGIFNHRWSFAPTGSSNGRTLTFTPTALGTYTVQFVARDATDAWGYSPSYTITVVNPASLTVTPPTQTYSTPAGTPQTLSFTLGNSGGINLNVSAITVAGAGFSCTAGCTGLPAAITPSGTRAVSVRFDPTSVGTVNGTMTITSNDPASPTVVPLTGVATPPISGGGTGLDFGRVRVTTNKDLSMPTIRNNSNIDLGTVTLTFSDPQFTCVANCTRNMGPNDNGWQPTIRFTPAQLYQQNGTVSLTQYPTMSWTLTGIGIPTSADVREQ